MSARAAVWLGIAAVYLIAMFALQVMIGHLLGLAWEIIFAPGVVLGAAVIGVLAGKASAS